MYDKTRIQEENILMERYGLKNKREIWKAEARVDDIRRQAKKLITENEEEQAKLIKKLNKFGFGVKKIADVLALNKEDWLKRRLQSVVAEKKLARTPKGARQLIVHKHVLIDSKAVNVPSYLVTKEEEDKIELRISREEKQEKQK